MSKLYMVSDGDKVKKEELEKAEKLLNEMSEKFEEAAVLGMKRRYCQKYTECACLGCPVKVDTDEKLDCALLIVLEALKKERTAEA